MANSCISLVLCNNVHIVCLNVQEAMRSGKNRIRKCRLRLTPPKKVNFDMKYIGQTFKILILNFLMGMAEPHPARQICTLEKPWLRIIIIIHLPKIKSKLFHMKLAGDYVFKASHFSHSIIMLFMWAYCCWWRLLNDRDPKHANDSAL